jgi:hypothetical protein
VLGCVPDRLAAQSSEVEKANILSAARQKYYNLKQAGLIEFQANIRPNWEVLLPDTDGKSSARTLLNGLHFSFSIDREGKLRLDHHTYLVPPNQRLADDVDKIFKRMDDSVSSFFGTWSIFSLTSPFPHVGSDYTIQKRANEYQFSQRQDELYVEVITGIDFKITEIRVSGSELTASLRPVLEKTANGFLLKGYTANSRRLSGARGTTVKALLEYEKVSGLQLLHRVSFDTVFEGIPAKIEWLFTDYQVKVR